MADPLFVFVVSGDPESHDDGFAKCAWIRVRELVKQLFRDRKKPGSPVTDDTVLRFIHFDAHARVVGIYEHDFAKQKDVVAPTVGEAHRGELTANWQRLNDAFVTAHGPLEKKFDPKEFVKWRQVEDDSEVSMIHVYRSVRKAQPGTVLELSVFSHAFVDGPVLYQGTSPGPGPLRSPTDTDGRAQFDFEDDMGEFDLRETDGPEGIDILHKLNPIDYFRDAFAASGSFRIWGCNIQDLVDTLPPDGKPKRRCLVMNTVRLVVDAAFVWPMRRKHAVGDLERGSRIPPGATKITLDMDGEFADEVSRQKDPHAGHGLTPFPKDRLFEIRYHEKFDNHAYAQFFRDERDTHNNFAKSITRTLSEIVQFVAAETTFNYFFKAAEKLKTVTVFAAPPGTSAEIVSGMQEVSLLDQAKFFSKFFNIDIIEPGALVQRHYAILDNQGKAVKSILDRKDHGLP